MDGPVMMMRIGAPRTWYFVLAEKTGGRWAPEKNLGVERWACSVLSRLLLVGWMAKNWRREPHVVITGAATFFEKQVERQRRAFAHPAERALIQYYEVQFAISSHGPKIPGHQLRSKVPRQPVVV